MLEEEYQLEYFRSNGFVRKICRSCGSAFWTLTPDRELCGDAPCEPYQFIGNPVFRPHSIDEMREAFLSFFESNNHTRIERYPVAARWRDDIYLTIASIADFQPFVTGGIVPPPANPLTISQPCIRLNDLDAVGRSGRHLTCFEMMAHHAFNSGDEEIYWKDDTLELCAHFITSIGGDLNKVTFKEHPWFGGGNAGPSVEVLIGGLEVATLVFMNLGRTKTGDPPTMIDGKDYYPMQLRIVDTGYGLERFVWASKGSPTIYDAVFPEMVSRLMKSAGLEDLLYNDEFTKILGLNAKFAGLIDIRGGRLADLRKKVADAINVSVGQLEEMIVPIEGIYALCDHTRCLAYMLGDCIVPSNVREGYLARLVLRRSLRMMNDLNLDEKLSDLVISQMETIGSDQFEQKASIVREIIERETAKYAATISRGKRIVERVAQTYIRKGEAVPLTEMITLYESHGIPTGLMRDILTEEGATFDLPDDLDSIIADMHSESEVILEKSEFARYEERVAGLPITKKLYYERPCEFEFEGVVLDYFDGYVILDQSLFYPEGGGQPTDTGTLVTSNNVVRVDEVIIKDDRILHRIKGGVLKRGERVKGIVDEERRWSLMRHHTGTHLLLRACKEVLGPHVHQAGAQKGIETSRLDIRHYNHITPEETKRIEILANHLIMENLPVFIKVEERSRAEQKYGFDLYQGGVPKGRDIRVVQMGTEVQACGGTHCRSSGEVGVIKILRIEHIQDGIERIEFSAGLAAIYAMQHLQDLINESADVLSVQTEHLPQTVNRFFNEWKNRGKAIEEMESRLSELQLRNLKGDLISGVEVLVQQMNLPRKELVNVATGVADRKGIALFISDSDGISVVMGSGDIRVDAGAIVRQICTLLGGKGGGKAGLAQGAGENSDAIPEALKTAEEQIRFTLHA
ncbi:MAG: alanine--tRNA ligase [Methanocalculus sp.]|uniref:alanine--tRNA ligase n=1 Tax=Methanocalculus sp. TaxID=2004547 RepID=UPI002716E948|nr:alanine--tRNA ligase [Methanocalculus sp.]MDO8842665.1 alanine--tRNA ligase [Methanocalculus sp.]MDO9538491.1 alanine--tRNA ligase [Methanocalculus sp.]